MVAGPCLCRWDTHGMLPHSRLLFCGDECHRQRVTAALHLRVWQRYERQVVSNLAAVEGFRRGIGRSPELRVTHTLTLVVRRRLLLEAICNRFDDFGWPPRGDFLSVVMAGLHNAAILSQPCTLKLKELVFDCCEQTTRRVVRIDTDEKWPGSCRQGPSAGMQTPVSPWRPAVPLAQYPPYLFA